MASKDNIPQAEEQISAQPDTGSISTSMPMTRARKNQLKQKPLGTSADVASLPILEETPATFLVGDAQVPIRPSPEPIRNSQERLPLPANSTGHGAIVTAEDVVPVIHGLLAANVQPQMLALQAQVASLADAFKAYAASPRPSADVAHAPAQKAAAILPPAAPPVAAARHPPTDTKAPQPPKAKHAVSNRDAKGKAPMVCPTDYQYPSGPARTRVGSSLSERSVSSARRGRTGAHHQKIPRTDKQSSSRMYTEQEVAAMIDEATRKAALPPTVAVPDSSQGAGTPPVAKTTNPGRYILSDTVSSPFTDEIMAEDFPDKFKMPAIQRYTGKTSPIEFIEHFRAVLRTQRISDAIMCQCLEATLGGGALDWYRQLPERSFSCFRTIGQALIDQFQGRHDQQELSQHLFTVVQGRSESLKAYLLRFREETLKVTNLCDQTARHALAQGIHDPDFSVKIAKHPELDFVGLLRYAERQADAQRQAANKRELHPSKRHDQVAEKRHDNVAEKRKQPDSRQAAQPGSGSSDHRKKGRFDKTTNDYPRRYANYTPLNRPVHQILALIKDTDLLQKPRPMRGPPTKRNQKKFCKFHDDYGHDTDQCFQMHDQIEGLIRRGYLQEFIKAAEKMQAETGAVKEPERPPADNRPTINTISGGPAGGTSRNKRKAAAREARHEVNAIGTIDPSISLPIMFTATDMMAIHKPHNDGLVVELVIDNVLTKRILIDGGSSCDVMPLATMTQLGWTTSDLRPSPTPLVGFAGDQTIPLGQIRFPVRFGDGDVSTTIMIDFVITDKPSAYNAIIGRSTIHALGAVPSTLHQVMRFPTPNGIGTVRGKQQAARTCYETSMRPCICVETPRLTPTPDPHTDSEIPEQADHRHAHALHEVTPLVISHDIACANPDILRNDDGDYVDPNMTDRSPSAEPLETIQLAEGATVSIGTELGETLREQLVTFLRANVDVFAWSSDQMPGIDPSVMVHRLSIDPSAKPVKQRKRAINAERSIVVAEEVAKLHTANFIRDVQYPTWVSNVVLVKKANGKWRLCIDFTNLNKACPKDSFPLPRIDQLVDATAGHELLSFMDAYSGYNQIKMYEPDQQHTAFITNQGLYCYTVMPFGLKNAGATYQRTVNKMFANQIGRNMEVYVDDMLVKSLKMQQHIDDLDEAFGVLRKYSMKLNPAKCVFGVTSGKFLGFVVNHRGIEANPDKIKAILDLQAPTTVKQLQRLNGMVAALSRFISRSADKCLPFFEALRKNCKFSWSTECDLAFQHLKQYLANAPLLARPEVGDELILYIAASATAVSSALIKDENGVQRPIYYTSKALVEAEQRYPEMEKLALALVVSARRLRPYFQAHKIIVLTNLPLSKVLHKPEASGRLMKWAIELSEYDVEFRPRPSVKGQAAADFVAELTGRQTPTPIPEGVWTLHVDGSAMDRGCGAGVLLISPEGEHTEYALRFGFPASNNEAEYEALLAGLRLAKEVGAQRLQVRSDSLLIVSQVSKDYQAKDERMTKYLAIVQQLIASFTDVQLAQIPRSLNSHADALARLAASHDTNSPRSVMVEVLASPSIMGNEVLYATTQVEPTSWMTPIKSYLNNQVLPSDHTVARKVIRQSANYVLLKDTLYKRSFSLPLLRCVTDDEAATILRDIHEGVCGDHAGARSLAAKAVRQGYFWPTMVRDAKKFATSCDRCQRHAVMTGYKPERLHFLTSPWPFAQWGIDLIGPLPKCKGQFRFAVVAVDYFTKWVEAEPLATITEKKITNFVWKNIVCRFGIPNTIISDNGRQFDNKNFSRFCNDLGIKHAKSSPAHPQANGQVEAVNKIIKHIIKTKIVGKKGVWADELPSVLWAYRTTARTATGETPYSLTFGTEAVLPIEVNIPSERVTGYDPKTNDDSLRTNLDFIEETREIAHMRNIEHKRKVAKYYNSRVKARGFDTGSLVLRKVMPNTMETGAGVLGVNWEGPYIVQATSGSGAYWLTDLSGQPIPRPWNIEHLRQYHT